MVIILKGLILMLVFISCILIGNLMAKKYINRVTELKDVKNALNMFETKIRFTYAAVPEVFEDIAKQYKTNTVGKIFENVSELLKEKTAGEAWIEGVDKTNCSLTKEDKAILKNLGKMLGKTDLEGQISELKLVNDFLNTQIDLAEQERQKNEKMYRTLGTVMGLGLVIILI